LGRTLVQWLLARWRARQRTQVARVMRQGLSAIE
jgi:hypothetical protein